MKTVIAGAGVIGLSLAYELAERGAPGDRIALLDSGPPARQASWAGAAILPPPRDPLSALSQRLYSPWTHRLREETGIDSGYWQCGAFRLAFDAAEREILEAAAADWRRHGVEVAALSGAEIARQEPLLAGAGSRALAAYLLPEEAQIRSPRFTRALLAACRARGVEIRESTPVTGIAREGSRIAGFSTPTGPVEGDAFVVAAGAWSAGLLAPLGIDLPVRPVRGQIVLFRLPGTVHLRRIVWAGARYLVPRQEGLVLAGSTEEEVGFDARTTVQGAGELIDFALHLAPGLRAAAFETAWAGLRPANPDGQPYVGEVPGFANLFAATGHFRAGFEQAPGTARALAQLLLGETPEVDLGAFRLDRPSVVSSPVL